MVSPTDRTVQQVDTQPADSFVSPFAGLIGQDQAVTLLTQAVARQHIAPGYLFVGPNGVGRALAAHGFAQLLLTGSDQSFDSLKRRIQSRNHSDLLWVEPTYLHQGKLLTQQAAAEAGLKRKSLPKIRLAQIKTITHFLSQPPLEAQRSVVVVEQAELMAEAAANGLLKTLEEPGQATLILIATDKQALLPTLISRCQTIPFKRLSAEAVTQVLTQKGHSEILNHPPILALAQGSPGGAISSWQMQQTIPHELLTQVTQPIANLRLALEIARHITQVLDTEAQLWLIGYLQHSYWQSSSQRSTESPLHIFEQARKYLMSFVQPRLVWETTLMQLVKS